MEEKTTEPKVLSTVTLNKPPKAKDSSGEAKPKVKPTEPWNPSTLLDYPAIPGMVLRWVDKEQISKKLAEGWIVHIVDNKHVRKEPTLLDGTPIDSTVHMRELILMKMPEEMAKSRNEYWQKMAGDNVKSVARKFIREAEAAGKTNRGSGGGAYGNFTVESLKDEEGDDG